MYGWILYMCTLLIILIINFEEDIKRSFWELILDLKSLELELKFLEFEEFLELELELIMWVVEWKLELKTTELELELSWKNGIDPNTGLITVTRSRTSLNSGPSSESRVSCDFRVMQNLPIIPRNLRACSFAGKADQVTWLDLQPG